MSKLNFFQFITKKNIDCFEFVIKLNRTPKIKYLVFRNFIESKLIQ